jgi:hypothetical protein
MSARLPAAAWEGFSLLRAWHLRHYVQTADQWLAVTIESMWLSGDPPDTTLIATWTADPDGDAHEAAAPIWNTDGSPASSDVRTEVLAAAHTLGVPTRQRPATDPNEPHDLFEATCAAWLWTTVNGPAKVHRAQRVGLIGAHPATQLAIVFPTPNGLEELRSDIWEEPGHPERDSDALAFELWIRFIEGG